MRTVRVHVPILVTVEKVATNEVDGDGWVPSPEDVAEEITDRMVGRDLDTGWGITGAAAVVAEKDVVRWA